MYSNTQPKSNGNISEATLYVFHIEEFKKICSIQKINPENYSIQFSWSMVSEEDFLDVLDEEASIKNMDEIFKADFSNRCYFVSTSDCPLNLIISITTSTRTFESPKIPVSAVFRSAWFSYSAIELHSRTDSISLSLFGACQARWSNSRLKPNYELKSLMGAGYFVRNLRDDPQVVFLESVLSKQVSDLKTQQKHKNSASPDPNKSPPGTEKFDTDKKGFLEFFDKNSENSPKTRVERKDTWDNQELKTHMHENKNGRYLLKTVLQKLQCLDDETVTKNNLKEILLLLKKAKTSFACSKNDKSIQQLEELEFQIEGISRSLVEKADVENAAPCVREQHFPLRPFTSVRDSLGKNISRKISYLIYIRIKFDEKVMNVTLETIYVILKIIKMTL
eukprot:GHVP01054274.1.p1 GENE.GHVP01054274.1~~GHVP01054274.1.p1  ORF type:complete len:392 (+),score=72.10 GHVP01054274.1:51-1226(+)